MDKYKIELRFEMGFQTIFYYIVQYEELSITD